MAENTTNNVFPDLQVQYTNTAACLHLLSKHTNKTT
jgi:hypothetical protein